MKEDQTLIDVLATHVLLLLDGFAEENRGLAEAQHVSLYPTYVLINASGERIASWIGYNSPESWAEKLRALAADPLTLPERRARLSSRPAFLDAFILGEEARQDQRYREAEVYLRQARALDPVEARAADVLMPLARTVYDGAGRGQFSLADAGVILAEVLQDPEAQASHALAISEWLFQAIQRGHAPVDPLAPILTLAHPMVLAANDASLRLRRQSVLIDYAYHVERDAQKALRLKRESMPAGWTSDPNGLNDFAWWCFLHRVNLTEAEALARRAAELTPPGPDLANCLDTLAQITHQHGDTRAALALIERAIQQNPGDAYLKEQETRFRTVLAEQGGQ